MPILLIWNYCAKTSNSWEIKDLFAEWLGSHYPDRAERVLSLIRQCRDGTLNGSEFGTRMRGNGAYAELLQQRFRIAARKLGLVQQDADAGLDASQFPRPSRQGEKLALF